MMIPNPDDAREMYNMLEKLVGKPNFPEEMRRPSKNGLSLDTEIKREIDVTKQRK